MTLRVFLFATLAALLPWLPARTAHAAEPSKAAWVLAYGGESTNDWRWDKRTDSLVKSRVSSQVSEWLLQGLSGPPDPVLIVEGRYASMSACVSHACPTKSFFWVDTTLGVGLGALWGLEYNSPNRLQLTSNDFSGLDIPVPARTALIAWLTEHDLKPERVEFLGKKGGWLVLDATSFQPFAKYVPSRGGPSFDCRAASGAIETTVCNDSTLAKLDLDVAETLESIRQGWPVLWARAELLEMHGSWLRKRDADCTMSSDVKQCLKSSYELQYHKLRNWLPTPKPPNQPLHPTPTAAEAPASGAGERRR